MGTLVGAALSLAVVLGPPATDAHAGEYHVYACRTPTGQVAPISGWSAPEHSSEDTTLNTCEEGGGLVAGLDLNATHPPITDLASWVFKAPEGEIITGATFWRAGEVVGSLEESSQYEFWLAGDTNRGPDAKIFEECDTKQCPSVGSFTDGMSIGNRLNVPASALGTPFLSLNVSCYSLASECPSVPSAPHGYAALVELFAADITLSDPEAPAVSAVGGGLAHASMVSGTSDIAFNAADAGSGVYEVVFAVDGQRVSAVVPNEEGGLCHDVGGDADGLPAFLGARPCPAEVSVDEPFVTTGLSNGPHHVLVSVLDAAGNATTVLDTEITVTNPVSAGSAVSRGPANGVDPSERASLSASWRGSVGARLSGGYGASHTVTGRLVGPEGRGIADAQIDVDELPAAAGARARSLPVVRTDVDGRWTLRVPRDISSCELRFAYRAHLGDAQPVATRTLSLSVRAGLVLRIAPRVAGAGSEIHFSGRLLGGPIPTDGKQLVLEARSEGSRWIEFHVIRAGRAGGRFSFTYRFRLPGPVTYGFRVRCEAEADYPYAGGSSNVVHVFER